MTFKLLWRKVELDDDEVGFVATVKWLIAVLIGVSYEDGSK